MKNKYDFNGKTILVADDDASSTLLAQVMLKDTGANIVIAQNGLEALALAGNNTFDLVLMDVKMPVMDGYQATTKIRQLNPAIPIIAYTACTMKEEKEKCFEVGFTDYLAKPVRQEQLLHTLGKYLKN
jgi:CheY-like chemotaxis protein